MAAGGVGGQQMGKTDPGAILRADRLASLRARSNRADTKFPSGFKIDEYPNDQTNKQTEEEEFKPDPAAELREKRMAAQRQINPRASTPELQMMTNSLRRDGDEEDGMAADSIEDGMNEIADQAAQVDDISALSKIRAEYEAKKDEFKRKMEEKAKKEFEKVLQKVKTEGVAKAGSAADDGQFFELIDTAGTAISVAHAGLSIFQDGMSNKTRETFTKQGFPMLKMESALDITILSGTFMQVMKWILIVCVILPFSIIFQMIMIGNIIDRLPLPKLLFKLFGSISDLISF